MVLCSFLAWLAFLTLLLVLLALVVGALFRLERLGELVKRLCPLVCRIAIILALLGGLVIGIWLCLCGPRLWRALREVNPCIWFLLLVLALLLVVLVLLLLAVASCRGFEGFPTLSRAGSAGGFAGAWPLLVLAVLLGYLLYKIVKCCGLKLGMALFGDDCARLLALAAILLLCALLLAMIDRRFCRAPNEQACTRIRLYFLLALVLAIVAVILVIACCNHLRHKDYDLAMVGIWWDGQFDGEKGAHLRWAFRYGLPFPPGGFDLYRRTSAGGSWAQINSAPIKPADVFQDAAPAPGPMWQHRAVDRLHPSRWAHFLGAPFNDLHDMVVRPPYSQLYFVQEPEDPTLPMPASPYTSEAALNAYLAAYRAAGTPAHPAHPLAQWRLEPMQALMIAGLHPEIARMLGLLYIDKTADPNVEYDYRIVGHWSDGDRSYTTERVSRPRTAPLDPPQLTLAQSPVTYPAPSGNPTSEDQAVALRWEPPTASPEFGLTAADGIKPVRYLPRTNDLGIRPCPSPPAPGPAFLPVKRPTPAGGEEEIAPLALTPEKQGASLVWPAFFFVDRNVDFRCYGYSLEGIDVFGRSSPLSNVLVADVRDQTGPPPPVNIEARVFQRADTTMLNALPAAERDALFPVGSTHPATLRVSWVWPNAFTTTVPDMKEFHVYDKISGYATFSQPVSQPLWPDPANWADTGSVVPLSAGQPLPPRLTAMGVTDAVYYETVVFDPPLAGDDDVPVAYGFAGVGGVDHDPFNNSGPVSPPTVIYARDFDPPAPPPIPTLDRGPDPTDKGSNALLSLSWDADSRYLYQLVRLPGKRLTSLPAPGGPVPPCLAAEEPTCVSGDPACLEQHRRFGVRVKAQAHPELFGTASMAPEKPQPAGPGYGVMTVDKVDATLGDDYLYASRAIDRAGNVSAIGCPQIAVVRDFMPPRAPTVNEIVGREGAVRIRWAANPEADLDRYRVYRTADPKLDGSLARMTLVLEALPDGSVVAPPGAAAATRTGAGTPYPFLTWDDGGSRATRDYYYRLVAVDHSGNISELSASAKGRAVDTTPPGPPVWGADPAHSASVVLLSFAPPPGDPEVRFRIQRQDAGTIFWRPISSWLDPGTTTFQDTTAPAGGTAYRIQAMDQAGNVGAFNVPRPAL